MSAYKVLNLYSGIGGNRKMWGNVDVVSVEIDSEIAKVYQSLFPNDKVVVGDAHKFLEEHYQEFDFIWSSPPCPTHGQYRYNVGFRAKGYRAVYPDMKLYEEIIFLKYYFSGKWIVENVMPYYEPLIKPTAILQRHLIWSNFDIPLVDFANDGIRSKNKISDYIDAPDISNTHIKNKRQVLRNCVFPELGNYIFQQARLQNA